jgi:hypothetical protein
VYGSEASSLQAFIAEDPARRVLLHPSLPFVAGQVLWAARCEMARTVEDVLARRTRALLLDARAAIAAAPRVAELLAAELHRDDAWAQAQIESFTTLAQGFCRCGSALPLSRTAAMAKSRMTASVVPASSQAVRRRDPRSAATAPGALPRASARRSW